MVRFKVPSAARDLMNHPAGHYLNLPVVENDGRLIAVVDVLKLTYATLEQMSTLAAKDAETSEGETGPLWGRFFESLAANDDAESALSGSNPRGQSFTTPSSRRALPVQESPHSELYPGDSASAIDEVPPSTAIEFPPLGAATVSNAERRKLEESVVDDGTYVFKFRTPSGRTHRFQALKNDIENLRDIVEGKLEADPFFAVKGDEMGARPEPRDFQLAYTDMDDDLVIISSNEDVEDAVRIARKKGNDRVLLQLQGGRGWENSVSIATESSKAPQDGPEVNGPLPEGAEFAPPAKVHVQPADDMFGIPKDLLLPVSIAGLAAVIVTVFTISRLTRD
jgi:hypothetical protein